MSKPSARDEILAHIRLGLKRGALDAATQRRLAARLDTPPQGTVPQKGQGDLAQRVATFTDEAERVGTTTERVAAAEDVPHAVERQLARRGLPLRLRAARDSLVMRIPWSRAPSLTLHEGEAEPSDSASVVGVFAGIAETGTLFFHSAPETPASLLFVPEMHIALLEVSRILASYEEAFGRLRARQDRDQSLPRTVNLITGPSRTSDIERTLTLGAHGPRFLHVIIIDAP